MEIIQLSNTKKINENTIELKNLRSISGINFFIPEYQRGYRWSSSEAEQMLNDFKEFCKQKKEEGEFYCLQPIVVRKKSWTKEENDQSTIINGYEVIDGQQRLTTLHILLTCVKQVREILYDMFDMFSITYETRLEFDSQRFLENIDNPPEDANNFIDFFYMKKVYDTMINWLSDKNNKEYRNRIVDALLDQKGDDFGIDKANNIRILWYEVADEESASSIDIFTRLNIGKIPLTNAELIKAMLLRRGNFYDSESSMKQLQISTEWNQIEQKLQDDSFWYFLYRTTWPFKYDNRIEFIFDLMKKRTPDHEFYFTFNKFNEQLEDLSNENYPTQQAKIEYIWQQIKQNFQTLEEWYNDRTLYHYIGFLIEYGADINELMKKSLETDKSDFLTNHLIKEKIKTSMEKINIAELSYGDPNIKKVLLLFNILTILQSDKSDMRFPFSKYKKEKWDIEHISSQTDKRILNDNQRITWLLDMFEFFTGSANEENVSQYLNELKKEIEQLENNKNLVMSDEPEDNELNNKKSELNLISKVYKIYSNHSKEKINDEEFDNIFKEVQKYCNEDKLEDKDNIYNLTLLDAQTNRGYGNAFFPIKRKWIISNDSQGIFVPIATKNVFLKYYTRKVNNIMVWNQSDAEDYLTAIEKTINKYLNQE